MRRVNWTDVPHPSLRHRTGSRRDAAERTLGAPHLEGRPTAHEAFIWRVGRSNQMASYRSCSRTDIAVPLPCPQAPRRTVHATPSQCRRLPTWHAPYGCAI